MKSFSEELANICGVDFVSLTEKGSYSVYGGKWVVIEGHKGLQKLGDDCISFAFADGEVCVQGENLLLKCLAKGFAVVQGKVLRVEQK